MGTNGYIRDVNGAPVVASVWESSFDTIWAQAGVDLRLETQQNLDMNAYVSSAVNPVNILNFQSSAQQNLYHSNPFTNAALEADLAGFTSSTGSTRTHHMLFANSYSNGTPLNTDINNPLGPLAGGLEGFGVSGLAITPSPGSVAPMRIIMATGAGVTQALEGFFDSPSGLPTVLAHELGHNGSLHHLNTATSSQHYDPMRSDALMWTGGGGSGSENVLNAGEVADTLRTMDLNGTLALAAGQTGTF